MPDPVRRRRSPILVMLALILGLFLVWGIWTWLNWGQEGMGVTTPEEVSGPVGAPPSGDGS